MYDRWICAKASMCEGLNCPHSVPHELDSPDIPCNLRYCNLRDTTCACLPIAPETEDTPMESEEATEKAREVQREALRYYEKVQFWNQIAIALAITAVILSVLSLIIS
jgi:hypothetical protein